MKISFIDVKKFKDRSFKNCWDFKEKKGVNWKDNSNKYFFYEVDFDFSFFPFFCGAWNWNQNISQTIFQFTTFLV